VSLDPSRSSVVALRQALSEHGGLLAHALADEAELTDNGPRPARERVASIGPRAGRHEAQYELLL
jgi:hypothetical protein